MRNRLILARWCIRVWERVTRADWVREISASRDRSSHCASSNKFRTCNREESGKVSFSCWGERLTFSWRMSQTLWSVLKLFLQGLTMIRTGSKFAVWNMFRFNELKMMVLVVAGGAWDGYRRIYDAPIWDLILGVLRIVHMNVMREQNAKWNKTVN